MHNQTDKALFIHRQTLVAHARYVSQRIDLRAMEKSRMLTTAPLIIHAGSNGAAVLFRYGVVVLFGLDPVEEARFLQDMETFLHQPFAEHETEKVEILATRDAIEGVSSGKILLSEFNLPRLQIVADVLAKSVILAHYESTLAYTFDRIEPLATKLQKGGRFLHQGRQLLQHIGDVLLIQGKMVGRVEVSEKPELLWEEPQYERLYLRLSDEYELVERHRALERKLDLVSKTAETLLELLQNRRSLRVEWYIVILIVAEIILMLYGKM